MYSSKTCLFRLSVRLNSNLITPTLVKELREKSGAGMMDCKKALADASVNGDINKAMDWLRSKGIARATSQVCDIINFTMQNVLIVDDFRHQEQQAKE